MLFFRVSQPSNVISPFFQIHKNTEREKKIYYEIIYGHMHDLTHRDLFKSKLKFSTVKIAFLNSMYISISPSSQTTTSIFHRYRQITSFSQKSKIQEELNRNSQLLLVVLLALNMEMILVLGMWIFRHCLIQNQI